MHPTRTRVFSAARINRHDGLTAINKPRKATNISGMDVSGSRIVVCSADTAWYYDVPWASGARQDQRERRERQPQPPPPQRRIHLSRDDAGSAGSSREGRGDVAGSTLESSSEAPAAAAVSADGALRGFRLPSSCVTEARFSGDEERCFFGSTSGEVFVVSPLGSRRFDSNGHFCCVCVDLPHVLSRIRS